MNIETLQSICQSLPAVTEDVKWGNDLCFSVAGKMFCVCGLEGPFKVSFKVRNEEFDEMTQREGIAPAAYVARYKWVTVESAANLSGQDWEKFIRQSYDLVKTKISKKIRAGHGL